MCKKGIIKSLISTFVVYELFCVSTMEIYSTMSYVADVDRCTNSSIPYLFIIVLITGAAVGYRKK